MPKHEQLRSRFAHKVRDPNDKDAMKADLNVALVLNDFVACLTAPETSRRRFVRIASQPVVR